jgi:site-specific DNA recombinase
LEGMIEVVDEFYSANLGQDIKRGMRENASRGFFNGSRPPYGLQVVKVADGDKQRNRLLPLPEDSIQVIVVRRIFDLAMKGSGCKEIAKTLNQEGWRTSNNEKWGRVTVHKVLTNEAYCGTLVWGANNDHPALHRGDPPIRIENAFPAIIEPAFFKRVCQMLAARDPKIRHPRTVPSPYLLSGILYCSCGRAMMGHSAKSGRNFYYLCSRKYKQGVEACNSRMIPKEKLEKQVIEQVRSRALSEDNLRKLVELVNAEIASLAGELSSKLRVVDMEFKDIDSRLGKLYDALETGKLSLDDLSPRIKELTNRRAELTKVRVQIEADMVLHGAHQTDLDEIMEIARDLRQLLRDAEFTERKTFLRTFVKRIEINGNNAKVIYRLPTRQDSKIKEDSEVLPIVTFGGAEGIRTPYLLTASQSFSQVNYGPLYRYNLPEISS